MSPAPPTHRPARDGALSDRADRVVTTHVAAADVAWCVHRLAEIHRVSRSYVVGLALALGLPPYRRRQERRPPQSRPPRGATLSAHVPASLVRQVAAAAKACGSSQSVVVAGAVSTGLSRAQTRLQSDNRAGRTGRPA